MGLHYHGAEGAYLSGDFDQAEAWYASALQGAKTPLDQAAIYRIQVTHYHFQGRNKEAIAIQRKSTELLGWSIPTGEAQIQASLEQQIETVASFLQDRTIPSLLDHPQMTDVAVAEILRILQILLYAAWLDGQTTLSLEYGNSEMSPFGYVGYGLIANVVLHDPAQGYDFGSMAVQLCEQFNNADVQGMTNFLFAADVHGWARPLREADRYYDNGYKYSMEAGNWLTVSFVMMLGGSERLTYGAPLEELHRTA